MKEPKPETTKGPLEEEAERLTNAFWQNYAVRQKDLEIIRDAIFCPPCEKAYRQYGRFKHEEVVDALSRLAGKEIG